MLVTECYSSETPGGPGTSNESAITMLTGTTYTITVGGGGRRHSVMMVLFQIDKESLEELHQYQDLILQQ